MLEAALKLAGGKCVINSINLEDGEGKLGQVCRLAKRYGSALIALTIDETGMAKTCGRKVEVARRIFDLATQRHGVRAGDLIFDPLTFTVCTGNEDDRRLALETLDALQAIKEECPGVHTLLGVSNVSFGLKPPARRVLNSVFLHHARERGLDAAIVHVSGIVPLYKIDEDHAPPRGRPDLRPPPRRLRPAARTAEEVRERRNEGNGRRGKTQESRGSPQASNHQRRCAGIEEDLDEAMLTHRPWTSSTRFFWTG